MSSTLISAGAAVCSSLIAVLAVGGAVVVSKKRSKEKYQKALSKGAKLERDRAEQQKKQNWQRRLEEAKIQKQQRNELKQYGVGY